MKNRAMNEDADVENIGIMQGFLDSMSDDDEDEGDDEDDDEMMDRRPDSPEILMNNLRGDMRSIDARREELANLVGYAAATETPEPVLAMLQPVLAQGAGIGGLPQSAPMAQGPQPPMMPPPGGAPGMPSDMPPGPPPMGPGAGLGAMPPPGAMGAPPGPEQAPIAMAEGGYVQRFQEGSDEDGVTPVDEPSSAGMYSPELRDLLRRRIETQLGQQPLPVPDVQTLYEKRLPNYRRLLGEDRSASQAQMLFDIAQRGFGYAANVDERGRPMRGGQLGRLAGAFQGLPGAIGARVAEIEKGERAVRTAALSSAEKEAQRIQELNQRLQTSQDRLLSTLSGQAVRETADERRERAQKEALEAKSALERNRQEQLTLRNQNNNDTRRLVTEANNIAEAERQRDALQNKIQTTTMALDAKQGIANQVNVLNTRIAEMRDALARDKMGSAERIAQAKDVARMERLEKEMEGKLALATLDKDTRKQLEADRLALRERLETARMELQQRVADDRNRTSRMNALERNATLLQLASERAAAAATPGFGKGLTGQQLNTFYQLSPGFTSGTLGEEGDRMFETAVVDYINRNTVTTTDIMGERVTRVPTLPRFVVTALTARGRQDLIPQSGQVPLGAPTMGTTPTAAGAPTPVATAPGAVPGTPTTAQAQAPAPGTETPPGRPKLDTRPIVLTPEEQESTFFNMAEKGTGPVAIATSLVAKLPIPGFSEIGPERQTAVAYLRNATNRINRALSQSVRFAETERQQIQKQLDMLPGLIDNASAYRNRLLGLDTLLNNIEQQAIRKYNTQALPAAEVRKAAADFQEARQLRGLLGMPPRIPVTPEGKKLFDSLPPGAWYIWNDPKKGVVMKQKEASR
jgi:hypothetical protein